MVCVCVFFNGNDGVVGLTYIFIKLRFFLFLLAGVLIRQDLGLFFFILLFKPLSHLGGTFFGSIIPLRHKFK